MSGRNVVWTKEMREARAAMMRAKWADPDYRSKQQPKLAAACRTPTAREKSRKSMLALHGRLKTDVDVQASWRAGVWRANGRPEKRAFVSKQMTERHRSAETIDLTRQHCAHIGKMTAHKTLNGKIPRKRRGGNVPAGFEGLYLELRKKKIAAPQALALVIDHAARAR